MVSGSPDVSNSFVSPCSNSFVSQSGLWCPALRMSPIQLSPLIAIHLSPIVAGGVRLSGCLQIHLSSLWRQFICLPVWLVLSGCPFCFPLQQFLCLPVWLLVSGSPDVCNWFVSHYRLVVSGSTDVSDSFVLPYSNSYVSQSGWWCPALRMSSPSCCQGCCPPVASKVSTFVV